MAANHDANRNKLIDSTITVIARDGFDKVSTRNIAAEAGLNDGYIYKYFLGKEDLLAKAFEKTDLQLQSHILLFGKRISLEKEVGENALWTLWNEFWTLMLNNETQCKFYVQYYYSPLYLKLSHDGHSIRIKKIVDMLYEFFLPNVNVEVVIQQVLDSIFSLAIKTYNGVLYNDEESKRKNFNLINNMLLPYLK